MWGTARDFVATFALISLWKPGPCVATRQEQRDRDKHLQRLDSDSVFSHGKQNASSGERPPKGHCLGNAEDKYKMGKELGSGMYGVTYKATVKYGSRKGETFVLKRVPVDKFDNVELGPMTKPLYFNLPLLAVYCPEGSKDVDLILPLMAGGDLGRYESPSSPDPLSQETAAMIALGLYYLHNAGYIHRDFKGDNIMQTENGVLTSLIDYGLIASWGPNKLVSERGGTIGNTAYRAPERSYREYGPEVDWFAFGLLLYHAHMGKRLYRSSLSPTGLNLRKHLNGRFKKWYRSDNHLQLDPKLFDLIAYLVAEDGRGRGIYNDCGAERCRTSPFVQGYPNRVEHPVFKHPYWESVNWETLLKKWDQHVTFHPALCQPKKPKKTIGEWLGLF